VVYVPAVGPLMLALHPPEMVTSWNVVAVLALRSVTVSVMLKVPLVAKLVERSRLCRWMVTAGYCPCVGIGRRAAIDG